MSKKKEEALTKTIRSKFDQIRTYYRRVSYKDHLGLAHEKYFFISVGLKNDKCFKGFSLNSSLAEAYQHSLVEAYRNLVIYQLLPTVALSNSKNHMRWENVGESLDELESSLAIHSVETTDLESLQLPAIQWQVYSNYGDSFVVRSEIGSYFSDQKKRANKSFFEY